MNTLVGGIGRQWNPWKTGAETERMGDDEVKASIVFDFCVHDLGVDTKPDEFMDAALEHEATVVGMSALLTTTMPNMGRTIEFFEDNGVREEFKMIVGGAPVTQEFSEDMGADGYGKDAIDCVDLAKSLVATAES